MTKAVVTNTTFRDKVYQICNQIPHGRVITYGDLARLAGSPGAARAVGMCMKTNPNAPYTPCHRVVAADGSLHGYSGDGGVVTKRQMLLREGVIFKGQKVDLIQSGWNGENSVTPQVVANMINS